jgi:amino acid adenylation domain-containing protein
LPDNPDVAVQELAPAPVAGGHSLSTARGGGSSPHLSFLPIHTLFEEQVGRTPNAIAAEFKDAHLTYSELDAKANQLAHLLQRRGAKPDTLIALCAERSLLQIVGVLGILKAGAAYLPLDSHYPLERLQFMLKDSQAPILLTLQTMDLEWRDYNGEVIYLDALDRIPEDAVATPVSGVHSSNIAYVIYTSGSTGHPKGVTVEHHTLTNLIEWQRQGTLGYAARTLQFSALSFDVSLQEMFSAWDTGGTLILISEEERNDPAALLSHISRRRVERVFLPFAALQYLADSEVASDFDLKSLRQIITAGERLAITPALRSLLSRLPDVELHNHYGPSETHVVTAYTLTGEPEAWPTFPPIGLPIAHTEILVLNEFLNPVPVGEPGELYIGGEAVGRGYIHQPDLTAQKFIPDLFRPSPDARLYRTGDLGRYLPDGNIEFLGRVDNQIKIRGFRVEVEEIEAVLREHSHVRDAAVTLREDTPGDRRLVAYCIPALQPDINPSVEPAELRRFLKQSLPEYMIPANFIFLERFPLTPSGKLDRRKLPPPERPSVSKDEGARLQDAEADGYDIEKALVALWQDILGVPSLESDDNFFELGGHSLLAIRILSRIRTMYRVNLGVRALFDAPTPAGLANVIKAALNDASSEKNRPSSPERHADTEDHLPLSFAQQRLWFLNNLEQNSPLYNVSFPLRLVGKLNESALERSLQEIVRRHHILRTTFPMINGEVIQAVSAEPKFALLSIDLRNEVKIHGSEIAHGYVKREAQKPFNLETGPLFRAEALRVGDEEYYLHLTMHHTVTDGWSLPVLQSELIALYNAFNAGLPSPLPELEVQYADYTIRERQKMQGAELRRQLDYWKRRLADAPQLLDLPTDHPRPPVKTYQGARKRRNLPPTLTTRLSALAQSEGVTLFMVLYAAFSVLLSRYADRQDIVIGLPIANRTATEYEGMIGLFVNTLAMRTDLHGDPTFLTLLKRVRESALEAYANAEAPFEKLVQEIAPERTLS